LFYYLADDFGGLFEEPKRDLKGELLAAADSMSFSASSSLLSWSSFIHNNTIYILDLEQLRLAAQAAKNQAQTKNGQ